MGWGILFVVFQNETHHNDINTRHADFILFFVFFTREENHFFFWFDHLKNKEQNFKEKYASQTHLKREVTMSQSLTSEKN